MRPLALTGSAMLSYRHAFHAGNHADLLKHITLVLALEHLVQKETPLCYIDTHAGAGRYRLDSAEAQQTGEALRGVAQLDERQAPAVLATWFALLRGVNSGGPQRSYPGSPLWAASLLRPADRLRLFELHPQDRQLLQRQFSRDRRVDVRDQDGFEGLKALLPPPSRRALVLIDPSYEIKSDYSRIPAIVRDAHRRFATGVYMVWYPLLNRPEVSRFTTQLERLRLGPWLRLELRVAGQAGAPGMYGSGMLVLNPPWKLAGQMEAVLPWLQTALGAAGGSWLVRAGD